MVSTSPTRLRMSASSLLWSLRSEASSRRRLEGACWARAVMTFCAHGQNWFATVSRQGVPHGLTGMINCESSAVGKIAIVKILAFPPQRRRSRKNTPEKLRRIVVISS